MKQRFVPLPVTWILVNQGFVAHDDSLVLMNNLDLHRTISAFSLNSTHQAHCSPEILPYLFSTVTPCACLCLRGPQTLVICLLTGSLKQQLPSFY